MKSALLIFPHQLFKAHPGLKVSPDIVVLTEDPLFFKDEVYPSQFHQQKLVLHRASLKHFAVFITNQNFKLEYAEWAGGHSKLSHLLKKLKADGYNTIHTAEVVDFVLEKRLRLLTQKFELKWEIHPTPGFLNTKGENQAYRKSKKRWFMADFYQHQRHRLNLLLEEDQKPTGGQWSFDEDNRKKLPKTLISELPKLTFPKESDVIAEAKTYVAKNFGGNPGSTAPCYYPVTHQQAAAWLEQFLTERLKDFGPYEDAIEPDQHWLYHSVLTPMLNTGLLTPQQVLTATLEYAQKNKVPLNSLEGFIRQIVGWREFMRATYQDLSVPMRTTNHWQHKRPLPKSFYDGNTGINPVDNTIQRVLKTGYCHHIERLMVLGGFMFLCEIDPDEVYQWFMDLFIDSYDWVMVTNVYAMSQNADGGLITTKPYFSGSNYIKKMSHYPDGEWAQIWDALYWRWIIKHADELKQNPRWAMMVRLAEKMDDAKKQQHLKTAESFLAGLE